MSFENDNRFQEFFESDSLTRLGEVSVDDCALIAEAKALYEEMYPQTRNGAQGGRGAHRNDSGVLSFSKYVASIRGDISHRSVERAVKIGANIPADIRDRIRDSEARSDLYRHKTELLALANHEPLTQAKILDLLEAGKAVDVAEAEEKLKLRTPVPKVERQVMAQKRQWQANEIEAKRRFVQWLRETGELNRLLAEPAVVPADDLQDRMTAADLAKAKLPGIPQSKKGVLALAESAGWPAKEVPVRGGTALYFHIDDLPPETSRELRRRRSIAESRAAAPSIRKDPRATMFPTVEVHQNPSDGEAADG